MPENQKKQDKWRTDRMALAIWIALVLSVVVFSKVSGNSYSDLLALTIDFITSSQYGPSLFILAYVLLPLLCFSATALTVASGALFGPALGVLYTLVGTTLSSSLAYLIGRYLGRSAATSLIQKSRWSSRFENLQSRGFTTVLCLRLLFVPFDLVNFAAGATGVRYSHFLAATFLGSILPITFFVWVGHGIS